MEATNTQGYFNNQSLWVTAVTRIYDVQLDEATIMSRTEHWSVDCVRVYKQTTSRLQRLSSAVLNDSKLETTETKDEQGISKLRRCKIKINQPVVQ